MLHKRTILLVEDEKEPAELLANFLEMNDYLVLTAHDGLQAKQLIDERASEIDLALLDIMVPHIDGKELCRKIRAHPILRDIPIIFLTAKDKEKDEIEGLELGADDYISKPASLKLVKAHVDSLIRRQQPENSKWIQYGDLYLDTVGKDLYLNQERVDLTSTEYALAELFFKNPKVVFTRQQILEKIGDDDRFVFDRTVDVHVKNLRLKLGAASDVIKTYRGMGYGMNRNLIQA
ncbi:MAG: response regulator transcription factor [Balneolaceae bacterium]